MQVCPLVAWLGLSQDLHENLREFSAYDPYARTGDGRPAVAMLAGSGRARGGARLRVAEPPDSMTAKRLWRVKMILPALTEATSPLFRPIKYSLFPPLGLATLAGYFGPDVEVSIHDEHVERLGLDDEPDLVIIQAYITSARRSYEIADHYRRRGCHVTRSYEIADHYRRRDVMSPSAACTRRRCPTKPPPTPTLCSSVQVRTRGHGSSKTSAPVVAPGLTSGQSHLFSIGRPAFTSRFSTTMGSPTVAVLGRVDGIGAYLLVRGAERRELMQLSTTTAWRYQRAALRRLVGAGSRESCMAAASQA